MTERTVPSNAPVSAGWRHLYKLCAAVVLLVSTLWLNYGFPSSTARAERQESHVALPEPPADLNPQALEPGVELERVLSGGELHLYSVAVRAGQFVQILVNQDGIDIVVTILDRDGRELLRVDRPSGARGPERVSFVAPFSGEYRLQLYSLDKITATGRYRIKVIEVRDGTSVDESRIAAEKTITEAETLRAKKRAELYPQALEKFEHALALWRALNEPYEQLLALYGAGLTYRMIGENQKAVDSLNKAAPIARELRDTYLEAVIETGLAWSYLYLGENDQAQNSFSNALTARISIGDTRGQGLVLHGLGWVHALKGDSIQAIRYFKEALNKRRSVSDLQGEALTLTGLGKVYNTAGRHREALDALGRAIKILRDVGDPYGEADALSSLGWVYNLLGDYQQALANFNLALPLRRACGDRIGEATTLWGIAEVERRYGSLLVSRSRMEAAIEIIELLGVRGTNQQLRISYFASVQRFYETYINLLQQLHDLQPEKGFDAFAFEASERARARSLLDLLVESRINIRDGADTDLLEAELRLQQRLRTTAEVQRRLADSEDNEGQRLAAKEVEELTKEYESIKAQIRSASPRYASLMRPAPLSLSAIQRQVLDERTMLLEISLGESRSYLWAVTPISIRSYELPGRAVIEAAAKQFYESLTARNRGHRVDRGQPGSSSEQDEESRLAQAGANLSRILLGPVAGQLRVHRLLIVADGALNLVPFVALYHPLSLAGGSHSFRPLVMDFEIVTAPSASTIAVLRRVTKGRQTPPRSLAMIADPVFTPGDDRVRVMSASSRAADYAAPGRGYGPGLNNKDSEKIEFIKDLPRVYTTRLEAQEIVRLVPQEQALLALDFHANLEIGTSPLLGQYKIVHFATHAFINDNHPALSGIALSLVDEHGRARDGYLRMYEILNLKLPVEMVVLSGCQTGLGRYVRGEGLLGLTRAFFYAGSARVVASVWAVNDRAAAELMVRFYRKMLGPQKQAPAEALRNTQIEMLKDKRWQSPYYWAPFILIGEWDHIG